MPRQTHSTATVVETHKGQDGTTVVARVAERLPAETQRLRRLAASLSHPSFTVTRGVIVSPAKAEKRGAPRVIEVRSFGVQAPCGALASRHADEAKFQAEVALGHHQPGAR